MLALTVAYDGTRFAGSQVQPGERTVQGELDAALRALGLAEPKTVFAGRTDRGVHASGQVVGCEDRWPGLPDERVRRAINAHLPDDVAVVVVERPPDGFHARFDARWREYRYRLAAGPSHPAASRVVWFRPGAALDLGAMREASAALLGRHDFSSFASGGEGVPWSERRERPRAATRTMLRCGCAETPSWWSSGPHWQGIEIQVAADGFLPRMVRNIVAALVEVGTGRRPPEWVAELLEAGDRRAAPGSAPAHGLTLWRVGYGDDPPPGPIVTEDRGDGRA